MIPDRRLTHLLKKDGLLLTFWRFVQEAIGVDYLRHFFSIDTALDFFGLREGEVRRRALCIDGRTLILNSMHVGEVRLFAHRTLVNIIFAGFKL